MTSIVASDEVEDSGDDNNDDTFVMSLSGICILRGKSDDGYLFCKKVLWNSM